MAYGKGVAYYPLVVILICYLFFTATQLKRSKRSEDNSSTISLTSIQSIMNRLKCTTNRPSTSKTYMTVWRQFNKFLIKLDCRPDSWEDRTALFAAYQIERGLQSASVRSYISAIKRTLIDDGYLWNDDKILLSSLTRACRLINDHVRTRLPIQSGLLELLLFEVERFHCKQPYLNSLFKALYGMSYYGLMRAGEVTASPHVVKAKDVHLAKNKEKLLLVLYSSKTHGRESIPQKIRITSNKTDKTVNTRHFCPFKMIGEYIQKRPPYIRDDEQFFVFSDRSPVTAENARSLLRNCLTKLGLNDRLYDLHSMRIGRSTELVKKFHFSIDETKRAGRWRSSCVFKYIRG